MATGAILNDNANPTTFLTIHLDISVNHSNPDTVFKALESTHGAVRLFVSSLTVVQLGDDRVSRFLKLLSPDHLLKLDFSYNGLAFYDNVNVELSTIFREMKKFTKLRSLCLSYSDFGESHLRSLSEILQELPYLVSLDLSGNYVGSSIGLVLNSIRKPLNCLRLAKCRIGNAGIETIARSKHASQLMELDVSRNCLSSECMENLLYIFESSKNTMREFCVHGNEVPSLLRWTNNIKNFKLRIWVYTGQSENLGTVTEEITRAFHSFHWILIDTDIIYHAGTNKDGISCTWFEGLLLRGFRSWSSLSRSSLLSQLTPTRARAKNLLGV